MLLDICRTITVTIGLLSFKPVVASSPGVMVWDVEGKSVVIEASTDRFYSLDEDETVQNETLLDSNYLYSNNSSRNKRQFPQFPSSPFQFQFPPGWPFIQQPGGGGSGLPGFPGLQLPTATTTTTTTTSRPPKEGNNKCKTRNGLQGNCATFRSCYNFLFRSIGEGEQEREQIRFRNPGLAEDIKERAGPCNSYSLQNLLTFKADVYERDTMICCADPDGKPPQSGGPIPAIPQVPGGANQIHPQITMRPPWAAWTTKATTTTTRRTTTTTTRRTTTTTTRPPTQRTTIRNPYPNWPPPFITHPPSHFPSWIQTLGTQSPTTTTKRPHMQWPPPLPTHPTQYPTHRPPSASTPASITQAPASSSCGYSKIVGGVQATKGEFPWLVAIMRHGRQICGGSILDSQWILSAAHCFVNFQPYDVAGLRIQIGDYDIYSNSDGPVTIRGVSKLVRHTGFTMTYLHNDIALLKLDSPIQFGNNGNNNIQPICLARSGGYEGTTVTVAGWGGIYEGGPQPPIYKKVSLQVWGNQQCAGTYGHRAPGGITSQMVCAGSPNADACRGDSGGPLMRNSGGRWEQIGVVSWGIGCGTFPGVYTRVEQYANWIANNRRH